LLSQNERDPSTEYQHLFPILATQDLESMMDGRPVALVALEIHIMPKTARLWSTTHASTASLM